MQDIRNIAIIAHVDHGKTTLVDGMLKQSGIYRDNQQVVERVMDSNELERERGITILAKNTSVRYGGTKINIVDTPGHSDFSGEVERVLKMVDGVLLLVDSFEGAMPQTRFVLRKALELNLMPIVVINKIDRPDARVEEVVDEVLELFIELDASDEQLDFPVVYASAKDGVATADLSKQGSDLRPLFETIIAHVPAPTGDAEGPLQLLVNNTEYDPYQGRMVVGRISRGRLKAGQGVALIRHDGTVLPAKLGRLYVFEGLERVEVDQACCGEIVTFAGIADVRIGDTVADKDRPEQLPPIAIGEPTLKMNFMVNDSPFSGQEGKHLTSREIRARLYKEMEKDVSLRVRDTDSPDVFEVAGRGELHLSILIETMRREGYELSVSKPEVIYKKENEVLLEPMELLIVDIPEDKMGPVMEMLGNRRGEMLNMISLGGGQLRLEFKVPARGLIGFRTQLLTETRGHAVMNHMYHGYEPYKGEIQSRYQGVLIASEDGEATVFGLHSVQDRGTLFISPGTPVYEGMIVGEHSRERDLEVNVCKKKHLTNMRSSHAEGALRLEEPRKYSLEQALEYLAKDELLEVTPTGLRMRKKYLQKHQREKAAKNANKPA
ncbi:translational GTPase TypA [Desulfofalx alkaliphila]|uniref:translational GTPase TypA n=1 Tax=Desulfofalx alkaliphila TaxID=105483 RepID=UPI0004E0F496|nr:translational GTPase TypA [Desulfofalx alkaliphila]